VHPAGGDLHDEQDVEALEADRVDMQDDIDDLQRATGTLNAFLIGAIRTEVAERRAARSTGTDKDSWQADLGPYLQRMLDTGRYPTLATLVHDATHHSAEGTFAQNLATVLDAFR
jgi:Tetracyclin repressor-like, C-terminal domain